MEEHVYTSAKGKDFLSWHNWALETLSEEDLAIYLSTEPEGEPMSEEKIALYNRWVIAEQILTHAVLVDDVEIAYTSFD